MTTRRLSDISPDTLRAAVAERYGAVATDPTGAFNFPVGRAFAEAIGYPSALLDTVPADAVASFAGVTYLARWTNLAEGETVVDLGAGAGLDSLIAARRVEPTGAVHAVDVSDEMVRLARANAKLAGADNVQVYQSPVEELPLSDGIADVVIANGVLNLVPEKERAVAELYRTLKLGGRYVGAEIVLVHELDDAERSSLDDWFR